MFYRTYDCIDIKIACSRFIYFARVKARHFMKERFNASRCGKAALYTCPIISRAEYNCQLAAQHCVQVTPRARPVGWARFTPPYRATTRVDLWKLPAAHLTLGVGPPSPRHVDAEPSGQSERSRITTYHWG